MRKVISASVGFAVLVLSPPSSADEAANTATARALGTEGFLLAEAGRCSEAIDKLDRAEKLHHAPTTATRLAECEIETGKLVSGTERLQRVVRETLPSNAHPAFVSAQARARSVLEKTLPRIPALRLAVRAPAGAQYTITIDGEAAPNAIVDADRRIDPGLHEIVVRGEGLVTRSVRVALEERETKALAINVEREANAAPVRLTTSEPPPVEKAPSRAPAIVAGTVGAFGLVAGIVGGVNVATKSYALENACDGTVCPPDRESDIRDAKTWATISTAGFITAGVGFVTAIVLYATAKARPTVGLGSLGATGKF